MPTPKPLFIRYAKLTLDDGLATPLVTFDYECSATEIAITSEGGDITSINTQCPEGSFSEANPRAYSLTINAVQDVESTDSLLAFAWQREGTVWRATFYPKTDAQKAPVGFGWEGQVTISMPDQIGGGEPGNFATMELVFPYTGRPSMIDADGAPVPAPAGAVQESEPVAV
jgi:hypothetical protein